MVLSAHTGVTSPRAGGPMRALLSRLALDAPTRVFVLEGSDAPSGLAELRLRDEVRLVDTPRSATILLVAGRLPAALRDAACRAHDAVAHPRAVVWWTDSPPPDLQREGAHLPVATVVTGENGGPASMFTLVAAVRSVAGELLRGERTSSAALLPDVDPAPWRGIGPYGQGGSGMTGGVPYGRPMTGRAPDRDGLELDQLPMRVGPFFPPFPAGLVLDVKLQGDVLQDVAVPGNAFAAPARSPAAVPGDAALPNATTAGPVLIAELERGRARQHLRWLAHALRTHGLDALGGRALALAAAVATVAPDRVRADVVALARLLERSRALGWSTAGVGVIDAAMAAGRGLGPVARAAGLAEDARIDDPAYAALGFEPVVRTPGPLHRTAGDARDRLRQRLAEAVQSLTIVARAGAARAGAGGAPAEGPRGPVAPGRSPSAVLLSLLPELLRGQEWGDAVTTVVSLDIDMREAAPSMQPLADPPVQGPAKGMAGGMGTGESAHVHHA